VCARASACVVVAAVAALPGLAGCGSSGRGDDAAATAERFQRALQQRDGETACAQLDDDTEGKLEQEQGKPCPRAIFELELPTGGTAASARVYVTSASVTLEQGGTLFLSESPNGWEVSSAGCRPTSPELPLDCSLEG
jgi:hypothetical protein